MLSHSLDEGVILFSNKLCDFSVVMALLSDQTLDVEMSFVECVCV